MYTEIAAAIQSVKTLSLLLGSARSLSNYNELVAAVSEVNSKLMEATNVALASQEKQSLLSDRIHELENKIIEFENWKQQIQRYQLFEFPTGTLAYALKEGMEQGEPTHYICTSCVDKRQISKMQPSNEGITLDCHICGLHIETRPISGAKRATLTKPN
jgi:hypothetical protein